MVFHWFSLFFQRKAMCASVLPLAFLLVFPFCFTTECVFGIRTRQFCEKGHRALAYGVHDCRDPFLRDGLGELVNFDSHFRSGRCIVAENEQNRENKSAFSIFPHENGSKTSPSPCLQERPTPPPSWQSRRPAARSPAGLPPGFSTFGFLEFRFFNF